MEIVFILRSLDIHSLWVNVVLAGALHRCCRNWRYLHNWSIFLEYCSFRKSHPSRVNRKRLNKLGNVQCSIFRALDHSGFIGFAINVLALIYLFDGRLQTKATYKLSLVVSTMQFIGLSAISGFATMVPFLMIFFQFFHSLQCHLFHNQIMFLVYFGLLPILPQVNFFFWFRREKWWMLFLDS